MRSNDQVEFLEVLNGLASIKGKQISEEALSLWWIAMKSWSIEDFKAAAAHLVTSCQFMPTPFDFAQLKRSGEPTAGEAWLAVIEFCRKSCKGESPGGRIDKAVRTVGGYSTIGHANTETQLPHIERRFKESYEELSDVEETRQALPQITMHELQNRIPRAKVDDALPAMLQAPR